MDKKKKNNGYLERKAMQTPLTETRFPKEYGGPNGPEPTRYGDWERKGRCIDF